MKTKLVSTWKIPCELSNILKIEGDINDTSKKLFHSALMCFIRDSYEENPILELLNKSFDLVKDALSTERWVCFENDIYFDKASNGFWLIKNDINSFPEQYESGVDLEFVEGEINEIIDDPSNFWRIPSKDTLLNITSLQEAPFLLENGRPKATCHYLYSADNKCFGFDTDRNYLKNSSYARALPFLPSENDLAPSYDVIKKISIIKDHVINFRNFAGFGRGFKQREEIVFRKHLFLNMLLSGFTLKGVTKYECFTILTEFFHHDRSKGSFSLNSNIHNIIEEDFQQRTFSFLLNEDTQRADIQPSYV